MKLNGNRWSLASWATIATITLAAGPVLAQEEVEANEVSDSSPSSDVESPSDSTSSSSAPSTSSTSRSPTDGVKGHVGLGYFSSDVPFGARVWMSRDAAVDLGIAGQFASGDLEAYNLGLDLGYVHALAHYHYSVVFARAGLRFSTTGAMGDYAAEGTTNLNGSLFLGAELFLGALGFPNVSVQGGYGLVMDYAHNGGSRVVIGTANGGLNLFSSGTLGFHIYL